MTAPAARFDVTVFVREQPGRQAVIQRNRGRVSLDLGADRRPEAIGGNGEARYVGIPIDHERIGIPAGLKAAGVDRAELDRLSKLAFQDSCHQNNPRSCREDDFRQIYTAAFA